MTAGAEPMQDPVATLVFAVAGCGGDDVFHSFVRLMVLNFVEVVVHTELEKLSVMLMM